MTVAVADLKLPEGVAVVLEAVCDAATQAFGADLHSIVLYGSAAEGRMRATSDVNVLIVLHRFSKDAADAIREPMRTAQAAINLQAMFVTVDEIPDAMEAFAQKFADVARRHVVLKGPDPFAGRTVSREALLARVRQVILNLELRLRHAYVMRSLRSEQAAYEIADAAGPLRTCAVSILELEGNEAGHPKEALTRLIGESGDAGFAGLLDGISEAREGRLAPENAAATLFELIRLSNWLYQRAARLS